MFGCHSPGSLDPGGCPNAPRAHLLSAAICGVRSCTAGSSLAGSGRRCRLVPTWCWGPALVSGNAESQAEWWTREKQAR